MKGIRGDGRGRGSKAFLLLAAFAAAALVFAGVAYAAGELTQKAGTAGCVSETGTLGACQDGRALQTARSVAVSPDGASAYVTAATMNAVAVFDRNPATGELTQKAGTAGCVSETGDAGECQDGVALDGMRDVAVSPDGTSVYVTSFTGGVAIFDRNTTTGAITQKAGTAGCVTWDGTAGACQDGVEMFGAEAITVSPDGASVYVTAVVDDGVAIFDRNTSTGELTQKAGTAGCVSEDGGGGACQDGVALLDPVGMTVSPDGASVYVATTQSDGVAVLDRNTGTGALTQKAGTAGCITESGNAGACQDGAMFDAAEEVAVSPDGSSVYATASSTGTFGSAVTIFDRNTGTGAISQKAGTAGCVSETGTAGACQDGRALSGATGVEVSPDGASVYVASQVSDGVAIFDRDMATGALTQKAGTAGCVLATGASCQTGKAVEGAFDLALSADGASLYVAAFQSHAVAVFDRGPLAPSRTLTVSVSGPGTVSGPGISCPGDCTQAYADAAAVSLTATSAGGSDFAGWTGSCSGNGPCNLTMSGDRAVTATFQVPGGGGGAGEPVDTDPPETTITKGPKKKSKKKKAAFEFSASEPGASFECSLDGALFAPCVSPLKLKVKKKPKKHSFRVRAQDAAGNADATPAEQTWKVKKKKKKK